MASLSYQNLAVFTQRTTFRFETSFFEHGYDLKLESLGPSRGAILGHHVSKFVLGLVVFNPPKYVYIHTHKQFRFQWLWPSVVGTSSNFCCMESCIVWMGYLVSKECGRILVHGNYHEWMKWNMFLPPFDHLNRSDMVFYDTNWLI